MTWDIKELLQVAEFCCHVADRINPQEVSLRIFHQLSILLIMHNLLKLAPKLHLKAM